MTKQVEAVYENGLCDRWNRCRSKSTQRVTVVITEAQPFPERSHPDSDYLEAVQKEVASMGRVPTLEEIHKITSKDPTSWAEAIIAERENGSD